MKLLSSYKDSEIALSKIVNTATVQADGSNPTTVQATSFIKKLADLMVTKIANKPIVCVGENIIYTIKITNNGPSNATEVILYDILPENSNLVAITVAQEKYYNSGGIIICKLGDLARNASTIVTITITPEIPGVFKNFVKVKGKEYDPNMENNLSMVTTRVNPLPSRGFDFF